MMRIGRMLLLLMMVMMVCVAVTLRGEGLGHTRMMRNIGLEPHALELQPVVNYLEFVNTRFQASKLLFKLLSRHGRGGLCTRGRR